MIKDQVTNFIEKYNLTGTFIVAFSGGYDSMCLLDILNKCGYNLVAVHLNHNWRGKESLKEAQNCETFAKQNNIKFYTETLSDDVEKTETAARIARYDFFKRCAEKFNSKVIFTAHNFDDNAETVLYRIIKGTGSHGLEGICEKREIFYRPLLNTTREAIENYCQKNNLSPNNDSSNSDTKYKRNLIRHKILPLMKEINPNAIQAINSLSQLVTEDNKLIHKYLSNELLSAEKTEQKHIIHKLLKDNNLDYDKKRINDILDFINKNKVSKSGKKMSLSNDLWLFVNNKRVEIITGTTRSLEEIAITQEGEYRIGDYIFKIETFRGELKNYPKDNEYKAFVELNNIKLTLRHRKDGDFIQPLGNTGTQKLKKYLNEKKVPQHEKDKLILLCNDNETLWVGGLGLSEKIKVKTKPTHIIELKGAL